MKKLLALLLALSLLLAFTACAPVLSGEEALLAKAAEEFAALGMKADNVTFAGEYRLDSDCVLWFYSENRDGTVSYLALECKSRGEGEYRPIKTERTMRSGDRVAILPWKGGYLFLINDPACALLQVTDASGVHNYMTEGEEFPCIFYNHLIPTEFRFADKDGNLLTR